MAPVNTPRYASEVDICRDALLIYQGASNPQGVARALVEMVDWYCAQGRGHDGVFNEDGTPRMPLALVEGQLLYLLKMGLGDVHGVHMWKADQYCRDVIDAHEAQAVAAGA